MNAFAQRYLQGNPIDFTPSANFKIDDDVPLPTSGRRVGQITELRIVLDKLKVGQSLTIPWDPDTGRAAIRPGNATRLIKDKEYLQRTVTEKGVKLVRVWRIQ